MGQCLPENLVDEAGIEKGIRQFLHKRIDNDKGINTQMESAYSSLSQECGKDELSITQDAFKEYVIRCIIDQYIQEAAEAYRPGLTSKQYEEGTLLNPEWIKRRIEEVIQAIKAERDEER